MPSIDMIGVNNRNLKNFEVSLDNSRKLASKIPDEFVKISESGINKVESIKELKHENELLKAEIESLKDINNR